MTSSQTGLLWHNILAVSKLTLFFQKLLILNHYQSHSVMRSRHLPYWLICIILCTFCLCCSSMCSCSLHSCRVVPLCVFFCLHSFWLIHASSQRRCQIARLSFWQDSFSHQNQCCRINHGIKMEYFKFVPFRTLYPKIVPHTHWYVMWVMWQLVKKSIYVTRALIACSTYTLLGT